MRHKTIVSLGLLLLFCSIAKAEYFKKSSFQNYEATGRYPLWSESWTKLEARVSIDQQGLPYVKYPAGQIYNPVTISIFGLLAYNRFLQTHQSEEQAKFLKMAKWLVEHQDKENGSWLYEVDYDYEAIDEKLQSPWISGMAQGVAISVLTRAYSISQEQVFLEAAQKALFPFSKPVGEGGVKREFSLSATSNLLFFEEYPTQPSPSYALNGFMFALLGLHDLAKSGNLEADRLFQSGMKTLRAILPLYDLSDGSSYDLVHLTRPPRPVHRDSSYHLVHITLLNALGSATNDERLLWFRDHWNSYGSPVGVRMIWLNHFAIWAAKRHLIITGFAIMFTVFFFILLVSRLWNWYRTQRNNLNKRFSTPLKSPSMQY